MRVILFASLYLFGFFTIAQLSKDAALKQKLDQLTKEAGYPGVVFAYVDSLGVPHPIVSGWANKEDAVPMTADHLLHGGSTGKTLVSALALQLAAQNKLNLDDPVSKYLGNYPWFDRLPNAQNITIRHLMQHTSGIGRYEFKPAFLTELTKDPDRVWKPEELIAYVLGDTAIFEAGKGFTYSDTNYILVGKIIEKITGEPFYQRAKRELLDKVKLTSFTPTNTRTIASMAQGYYDPASEYALGFKSPFLINGVAQNNMQFEWTGGGYAYKTHEYAQWLKYLYEGAVFDLDAVREDLFNTVPAKDIGGEYGLGVHKFEFKGLGTFYGHDGFFPGYFTIGLYSPTKKMAFAMQINSTDMPHLQRFFNDYLTMVRSVLEQG